MLRLATVTMMLGLSATAARAQSSVAFCRGIQDSLIRLRCYDAAAEAAEAKRPAPENPTVLAIPNEGDPDVRIVMRPILDEPIPPPPSVVASLVGRAAGPLHAILVEEGATTPSKPVTLKGQISWRADAVTASADGRPTLVLRGVLEIPTAALHARITLRQNLDGTLAASHMIETEFTQDGKAGEPRRVREVGLPQLKDREPGSGVALAGLPVAVRDNLFLIGLSSLPADLRRNTALMLDKGWVDLPIRYASGGRAVLTFEGGGASSPVFRDALAAWKQALGSGGG